MNTTETEGIFMKTIILLLVFILLLIGCTDREHLPEEDTSSVSAELAAAQFAGEPESFTVINERAHRMVLDGNGGLWACA